MPLSPAPNETSDLVPVFRHKFESVFDMHGVKIGSPEDLGGFIEKLRSDRYFAMDFWDIAQSAGQLGKISQTEIRHMVVRWVGGPGVQDTDRAVEELKQIQSEFDGRSAKETPVVDPPQSDEAAQSAAQDGQAKTEGNFDASSDDAAAPPEVGSRQNEPAYTIGPDPGAEEHVGAFPYSRSRQMDDALARLEINSNELKLQLENIDSRMSRIEPHIEDLSSRAAVPAHRDSADDWVREPEAESPQTGAGPVEGPPVERRQTMQPSIHADGRGRILAIAPVLLVMVMLGLMAWLWKLEYGSRHRAASSAPASPVTPIAGKVAPSVTAAGLTPAPGAVPQSPGSAAVTPPNKVPAAADSALLSEKISSKSGPVDHASQRKNRTRRVSSARQAPAVEEASDPSEMDVIATSAPGLAGEKSSTEDTGDAAPRLERRTGSTASGAENMSNGISVSFGIMASHLIESRPPRYPKLARLAHIQGPVVLQAFISKNGTVDHVEAVKGHRLLRGAAKNAVKQWRYRPYLLNGRPVEVATIVTVNFRLEK